ncbi:MAG: glycosyltransferase family 4 protein [Parcubacteria group bacterium]|nr:glycosyltransferase family 4 protein [Parcubacteria group bacterium]
MKVGFISSSSFQAPGGVKSHILNLHHEFEKRGVSSKIIVPRRSRSESAAKYGKDVVLVGTAFPIPFNASQADISLYFNLLSLQKILKRERFDVLHFHNFGFPSILEILSFSKATNIMTLHSNPDGSELMRNLPWLPAMVTKVLNWKIQGVIAVSPVAMEMAKGYRGPKRIISNGIDITIFKPASFKKPSDAITLLFVGRLEERKGLLLLLEAMKLLQPFDPAQDKKTRPQLRLLVVGEGEEQKKCAAFIKKNKLQNIRFLGKKTDEELISAYQQADIFCSPALYGESFGMVLLEAMACGLPIVAFANRGYRQFLEGTKGASGLVPVGNSRLLAETIDRFIKKPQLRKELGAWGKKEAQRYAWPVIAKQVLNFYEEAKRTQLVR